jgi:hypothetical protein
MPGAAADGMERGLGGEVSPLNLALRGDLGVGASEGGMAKGQAVAARIPDSTAGGSPPPQWGI